MKHLFTSLLTVLLVLTVSAQDIMPAQFRAAPLLYNPAYAGLIKEDIRVSGIYLRYWGNYLDMPNTFPYASVDAPVLKDRLPKGDALGLGISGTRYFFSTPSNYKEGNSRCVSLSAAYHKSMGTNKVHHISLGLQASFINKRQEYISLLAPKNDEISYEDAALGLLYSGTFSDRNSIYAGFAIYHPGQPVETFFNSPQPIYRRSTAQIGWNFKANRFLSFQSNAMFSSQGSGDILSIGSGDMLSIGSVAALTIRAGSKHPATMYIGGWLYSKEALVPYLAAEWYNLRLGASYGYNMNQFIPAINPASSFELSLVYYGVFREPNKHWNVPRM